MNSSSTNMKDVILWSGGIDSTYLVDIYGKKSSCEDPIYVYSINHNGINEVQQKLEKRARKRIKKYFDTKKYHIKYYEIDVSGPWEEAFGNQPLYFISSIVQFLPDDSILHTGHIFEDSIWHKKSEIINSFKWLNNIKCTDSKYELCFDLEWAHKEEILKNIDKKLLKMIWTCENPTKKEYKCGKCNKCLELKKIK